MKHRLSKYYFYTSRDINTWPRIKSFRNAKNKIVKHVLDDTIKYLSCKTVKKQNKFTNSTHPLFVQPDLLLIHEDSSAKNWQLPHPDGLSSITFSFETFQVL